MAKAERMIAQGQGDDFLWAQTSGAMGIFTAKTYENTAATRKTMSGPKRVGWGARTWPSPAQSSQVTGSFREQITLYQPRARGRRNYRGVARAIRQLTARAPATALQRNQRVEFLFSLSYLTL